jgi:lysophospholipase L1-like esterase
VKRFAALLAVLPLAAQQPLLNNKELGEITQRTLQLMESVSIVVPDLPRAALPLVEQMKQAKAALDRTPQSTPSAYDFVDGARKFIAIADAMPRPYPFPEVGVKQFGELRECTSRLETHFRALLAQQDAALRPADRDQIARYADSNGRLGPPAQDTPRVVFLGDSITDGWRLNEYFPGKDYVNRGISGQITSQMLARMKSDVMNLKPQGIVLLGGTNDIARDTPLQTIQNNITMICDLADSAKIKVILASVLPIHDYNLNVNPSFLRSKQRPPETIRNLNNWIRTFASNRGYTYLDYFSPMVDSAGFLRKELADDGLQPNATGYRVMAPLVQQAIDDTLAPTQSPRKKR